MDENIHVEESNKQEANSKPEAKKELTAGDVMDKAASVAYWFYAVLAAAAIVTYAINQNKALYIITGVLVVASVIQFFIGWVWSRLGILLIPVGIGFGIYLWGGLRGACLGIAIAFLIRHIFREIVWKVLLKLFR